MTVGSRARYVAVLLAVALPAAAMAAEQQDNRTVAQAGVAQSGPVRLLPRKRVTPPPQPETETPPAAQPDTTFPGAEPRRKIQDIEVNPLSGPDPDEAGTLDSSNGGLGNALWDGMPRDLILHLVQRLPGGMPSPTMRDMVRRMLLTTAVLPSGGDDKSTSLIAARVERLQAMGLLGSAGDLISVAPNRETDDTLRRLQVDNALMRNDLGGACADAARQSKRLTEVFWQQLLIYCQAIQGDTAGASLGANILSETGQLDDPVFFKLVDQLVSGNKTTIDSLAKPTPLLLSMMRTANVPIPADAIANASPPLLGMIGSSPNAPIEIRLEAAEQAARFGAMSPQRLAEVYASVSFSKEDLDNALSIADVTRTPRGRALLYQAAQVHDVPTARAEVIQKGLTLAREDGRYALMVRVFEPLLTGLAPSGELSWFAADAGKALYVLGRADLARAWLEELHRDATQDPSAETAANALWAIATLAESGKKSETASSEAPAAPPDAGVALAESGPPSGEETAPVPGGPQQSVTVFPTAPVQPPIGTTAAAKEAETPIDPANVAAWRDTLQQAAPDQMFQHMADAFTLMSAAGIAVGDDQWRSVMGEVGSHTAMAPDPGYSAMLIRASGQGRRGETILLAALMVGKDGVAKMDLAAVADIVSALRQIGLTQEARNFAVEVAVQVGL